MTRKYRIAVLIDWYLPGTKAGGPVRSVYSLVQLLKHEYDFYIITSNTDLGSEKPYEGIDAGKIFEQDQVHFYYSRSKSPSAEEIMHVFGEVKPDLIYLNSLWSYGFSISVLHLRRERRISAPVVLAPRGMLGKGAMQIKSLKKRLFLLVAKIAGLHKHIVFHATNTQEAGDIRHRFAGARISVVPNINAAAPVSNAAPKEPNVLKLFYLSRISPVKNLHFALQILKAVPADYQIIYDIYGNVEDAGYWEENKKLIAELPSHITVSYQGELQFHEVQKTARSYHALFLPTRNENFGHSIVESLMSGCITVISDQTPWSDVNGAGGYALPLDNPSAFVAAICECAALAQEAFTSRSSAAIDYITKKTDLAKSAAQFKTLFDGAIKDRPLHL